MSVTTTTHLNFRGEARAALERYGSVFGATPTVVTYGDAHDAAGAPDQVIWGQVEAPNGFRVMAYDVQTERSFAPGENAFYVALRGDDADEITGFWEKLSAGATVLQPLGPSPWSPLYGMLTDEFGVTWVVDLAVEWAG